MLALPFQYLIWHYTQAVRGYVVISINLLWYIGHLFSIGFLIRTLFVPWKRRNEVYSGGGIEKYLEAIVVSGLSRVVGVVIKVPIIISGGLVWCVAALLCAIGFLVWVLLPAGLFLGALFGSYLLYV